MIKREGERGSPCLSSCEEGKKPFLVPLRMMEYQTLDNMPMNSLVTSKEPSSVEMVKIEEENKATFSVEMKCYLFLKEPSF